METMIEDFLELLQIPCENPGADMTHAAEYLAGVAQRLGYRVRVDHVPESEALEHSITKAVNILADIGPKGNQALLLNAHFDTTAPGDGWTMNPYGGVMQDGVIYGRGAAVSKSDVIVYLYAVHIAKQVVHPSFPVHLMLTGDEEMGGYLGPQRLLSAEDRESLVVAICPGSTYMVMDRHGGALLWIITLTGRARHAAVSSRGGDSVEAGADLIGDFYRYRDAQASLLRGWLTCGIARGGVAANMVSGSFQLHIDRRIDPRENVETVRVELRTVLQRWGERHLDIDWDVKEVVAAEPMDGAENHDWAEWFAAQATTVLQQPITRGASALYTDARHFAQEHIPTVCYGAGRSNLLEVGAHGPNEHVAVKDLSNAVNVISTIVATLWNEGPKSLARFFGSAEGDGR